MASKTVSTDLAFVGGAKASGLPAAVASGQALAHQQIGVTVQSHYDVLDTIGGIASGVTGSGTVVLSSEVLTNGDIGVDVQAYDADLTAIAALSSGLVTITGAGTAAARTITLGSSLSGSDLNGVSGNPTIDAIQDIRTSASPVFAQVVVRADGGTGITATRYSTNTGGPNFTLQKAGGTQASPLDAVAGYVAFNLLAQARQAGAFRTIANITCYTAPGFGASSDSPGRIAFQTTPVGSYTQRDVILCDEAGNLRFVVAGALNAAATDVVSMVGVDVAAADRQLYARTEANQANRLTGLSCRVSSDFTVTSSTTLANVTGLTRNVAAGEVYGFRAVLFTTSNVAGGVKAAIAGTCTATSIIAQAHVIDGSTMATMGTARVAALATALGDVTAVTAAMVVIEGQIVVNAAGTLTMQFAQNASHATGSVVKAGSYMELVSIGS